MSPDKRDKGAGQGTLVVSACLLGRACRYDGAARTSDAVMKRVARGQREGRDVQAVCPEELGGLGTPRPAAELHGGDGHGVWSGIAGVRRVEDGSDVTEAFIRGANKAADVAGTIHLAILKARSPSCGCGSTWIDGEVVPGDGVFAALLKERGVRVVTDEDLP